MIEFLSSWVRNIIYIIIFIVFLEVLLPNNSMRKYVKAVAGLLVIVVILTPFTRLFGSHVDLQHTISKYYLDINQLDVKNKSELLEGQQHQLTMRVYRDRISQQIKNQIERLIDNGIAVVEVDVNMDPEDERYGEINIVDILFIEKPPHDAIIQPIKKIEIGSGDEEQEKGEDGAEIPIDPAKEKEIKELILDFYNVPIQNISINKQRNNTGREEQ